MLIGARVVQGVYAALLTPAALALLTVTFLDPRERAKAFAVNGAIAGGGMAGGDVAAAALGFGPAVEAAFDIDQATGIEQDAPGLHAAGDSAFIDAKAAGEVDLAFKHGRDPG